MAQHEADDRARRRLLVVKLGSSSVTKPAGVDASILGDALTDAITAMRQGWGVVLVSSGAQALGRSALRSTGVTEVSGKAAAAYGQPVLMQFYGMHAQLQSARVSQFLVGASDLRSERRMRALSSVIVESLEHGIVPIVNGNDPADADKSNNDLVASSLAAVTGADALLLLTDVDGVYAAPPFAGPPLATLSTADLGSVKAAAGGGTGGMPSKLRAAELAANLGIDAVIANARRPHVVLDVVHGEAVGTRLTSPLRAPVPRGLRWIGGGALAAGAVVVNVEAERSVFAGSSLFASGVKRVTGTFAEGDVVDVLDPRGRLLARGRVRVSSELLSLLRASRVEDIAHVLAAIVATPLREAAPSGAPTGPAPAPQPDSDDRAVTPRVAAALEQYGRLRLDARRALLGEVLRLFPEATANLIASGGDGTPAGLAERYLPLVAGLTVVRNDHLATFEHAATAS